MWIKICPYCERKLHVLVTFRKKKYNTLSYKMCKDIKLWKIFTFSTCVRREKYDGNTNLVMPLRREKSKPRSRNKLAPKKNQRTPFQNQNFEHQEKDQKYERFRKRLSHIRNWNDETNLLWATICSILSEFRFDVFFTVSKTVNRLSIICSWSFVFPIWLLIFFPPAVNYYRIQTHNFFGPYIFFGFLVPI